MPRLPSRVGPADGGVANAAITGVLAGAAAAVATWAVLRDRRRVAGSALRTGPGLTLTVGPAESPPPTRPDEAPDGRRPPVARPRHWPDWCLLLILPALIAGSIWAPIPHLGFIGRILIVACVQVTLVGALRWRPASRSRRMMTALWIYLAVFWCGCALALLGKIAPSFLFFDDSYPTNSVGMLALIFVGILVLCIPAAAFAGMAEFEPILEPILYGAMAVIILLLCLPAYSGLTQTVGSASDNGSVTLYVSGKSKHFQLTSQLTLPGIQSAEYGGETIESIGIADLDRQPFRWALVLRGGARLTDVFELADQPEKNENLGERGSAGLQQPTQIISGESGDGIESFVSGRPVSTFTSDTASRRTALLPDFEAGYDDSDQASVEGNVSSALRGTMSSAPVQINVDVVNSIQPQDTIESVTPAPMGSGSLSWRADGSLQPSFELVDSDRADTTEDVLFVIAVLLGVAATALLMAIQAAIKSLGQRRGSEA